MKSIGILLTIGLIALTGFLGVSLFRDIRERIRAKKDKANKRPPENKEK